jgi:hypothetical protein
MVEFTLQLQLVQQLLQQERFTASAAVQLQLGSITFFVRTSIRKSFNNSSCYKFKIIIDLEASSFAGITYSTHRIRICINH